MKEKMATPYCGLTCLGEEAGYCQIRKNTEEINVENAPYKKPKRLAPLPTSHQAEQQV